MPRRRLDELRKAQAAAEARAQLFKDFIRKLEIDDRRRASSRRDPAPAGSSSSSPMMCSSIPGRRPSSPPASRRSRGREGAGDGARSIVPGRRRHRQRPHPDAALPLELGALDGARGRGRRFPRLAGVDPAALSAAGLRRVRSGREQRHDCGRAREESTDRDHASAEPRRARRHARPQVTRRRIQRLPRFTWCRHFLACARGPEGPRSRRGSARFRSG